MCNYGVFRVEVRAHITIYIYLRCVFNAIIDVYIKNIYKTYTRALARPLQERIGYVVLCFDLFFFFSLFRVFYLYDVVVVVLEMKRRER